MVARRLLLVAALALSAVRCADQPPTAFHRPTTDPQFVRWAPGVTAGFTARTTESSADANVVPAMSPPLNLDNYAVSFWAVRGAARSVRINYVDVIDGGLHPFLELSVSDPIFASGVGDLAAGDSVLVTVTVDTTNLGVSLEPHGLQFGAPAQLTIWYGGARGDLNGDAVVDSTDAYIENQLLSVWYSESGANWSVVNSSHDVEAKAFTSELPHFSLYALGFLLDWVVSW